MKSINAKKIVILALAMILMCGACVGGTYAWLMARTPSLTNSFVVGNVSITLTESTGTDYKMIPGTVIAKDPVVTVEKGSEACYVFVKIEEAGVENVLTYALADGWTALADVSGVYYRLQDATTDADVELQVLAGDQVTVKDSVNVNTPNATLTFTAYAIQQAGVTDAATAWSAVSTASADQFKTNP